MSTLTKTFTWHILTNKRCNLLVWKSWKNKIFENPKWQKRFNFVSKFESKAITSTANGFKMESVTKKTHTKTELILDLFLFGFLLNFLRRFFFFEPLKMLILLQIPICFCWRFLYFFIYFCWQNTKRKSRDKIQRFSHQQFPHIYSVKCISLSVIRWMWF